MMLLNVEETYLDPKEHKKTSKIVEGVVELKNASDARLYFRKHKTEN